MFTSTIRGSAALLLAACASCGGSPRIVEVALPAPSAAAPAPIVQRAPQPSDPLDAGAAARFPRRAKLHTAGPLHYRQDGGAVGGDDEPETFDPPMEVMVVSEGPRDLRVVAESPELRLLLSFARTDFSRVPVRAVDLLSAPGAAVSTAGARLAPGTFVKETQRTGGFVQVTATDEDFDVSGWIAADALSEVFDPAPFTRNKCEGLVAGGTEILVAPGGRVAGVIKGAPRNSYAVELSAGAPAGWQSVRVVRPGMEVRGVVPAATFKRCPEGEEGYDSLWGSLTGGGDMTHVQTALLHRGELLFDPADLKTPVGRARTDIVVYLFRKVEGNPGLYQIQTYMTPFGFVSAVVREVDLRPLHPR